MVVNTDQNRDQGDARKGRIKLRWIIGLGLILSPAAFAVWGFVDEGLEPAPELAFSEGEGEDAGPLISKARGLIKGRLRYGALAPAARLRRDHAEALKLIDRAARCSDLVLTPDMAEELEFKPRPGAGSSTQVDPVEELIEALFAEALERLDAPGAWVEVERRLRIAILYERARSRSPYQGEFMTRLTRAEALMRLREARARWPQEPEKLRRWARALQALGREQAPPLRALISLHDVYEETIAGGPVPEDSGGERMPMLPPTIIIPEDHRLAAYHFHPKRSRNALRRFTLPYARAFLAERPRLGGAPRIAPFRWQAALTRTFEKDWIVILNRNAIGTNMTAISAWVVQNFIDTWALGALINEAAATELAIRAFQLEQGRSPQSLSELVPGILPELPQDLYSGEALRYEPERGILYSLGIDGQDRGGLREPRPKRQPRLAILRDEDWLKEPTFFLAWK